MATVTAWTGSYGGQILSQSDSSFRPSHATGSHSDAVAMGTSCMTYDGTNDFLNHMSGTLATFMNTATNEASVLMFHNFAGKAGTQTPWAWGEDGSGSNYFQLRWEDGNKWQTWLNAGYVHGSELSGSHVTVTKWNRSAITTSINNVTESWVAAPTPVFDRFRLGSHSHSTSPSLFYSGSIAEVMVVSRSLQDVEVEGYKRHVLKNYLNPENIPNLKHRWIAGKKVVAEPDTDVLSWTDVIGRGVISQSTDATRTELVHFTEGFANSQTYITASSTAHLSCNSSAISASFDQDYSLFFVLERDNDASAQTSFELGAVASTNRVVFYNSGGNKTTLSMKDSGGTSIAEATTDISVGLKIIGIAYNTDGTVNFAVNGKQESDSVTARSPVISPNDTAKFMNGSSNNQPAGKLFELMIFDRALSFPELQNLTAYAKLKYGIE